MSKNFPRKQGLPVKRGKKWVFTVGDYCFLVIMGRMDEDPASEISAIEQYEATEAIRALDRPDAKEIPIIAMTADAFAEDMQKCLDCGMNAHVAKPIDGGPAPPWRCRPRQTAAGHSRGWI